jgi:hypothetical protein
MSQVKEQYGATLEETAFGFYNANNQAVITQQQSDFDIAFGYFDPNFRNDHPYWQGNSAEFARGYQLTKMLTGFKFQQLTGNTAQFDYDDIINQLKYPMLDDIANHKPNIAGVEIELTKQSLKNYFDADPEILKTISDDVFKGVNGFEAALYIANGNYEKAIVRLGTEEKTYHRSKILTFVENERGFQISGIENNGPKIA